MTAGADVDPGGPAVAGRTSVWRPAAALAMAPASPRRLAWRRFRRNRLAMVGLVVLSALTLACIFAPLIVRWDPLQVDVKALGGKPPSPSHPLGSDGSGRDVLARVLYGGRVSLSVGLVAVSIYLLIGTVLGSFSGYFRGPLDSLIMRITDTVMSFPALIIIIAIVPILGPSIFNIMLVIGLLGWPQVARIVRAEFLSLREREFTLAARGIGARPRRIIFRHILPNVTGPLVVVASFGVADAIITEAGLSLLGLGVRDPDPSWGNMLSNVTRDFSIIAAKPWLWIPPAICIATAVLSINFIGDGLRDALDPRASGRR